MALKLNFNSLSITNNDTSAPISPDLEPNRKRYNCMELILQEIQKATQVSDADKIVHNPVIHKVTDDIIEEMRRVDPLFKNLFNKKLYGGSYYDGLKVNAPDEYDLDLALKLPKKMTTRVEKSCITGFVRIYADLDSIKEEANYKEYRAMEKMVDSKNYLIPKKVREWYEGVINKTRNNLLKDNKYKFDLRKSGPAMTLFIEIGCRKVCVDLVPAFIFSKKTDWPASPFRKNPTTAKDEFLVVPKDPPSGLTNAENSWRLSFQEQEKEIINGKNGLKDTIRLLKLLRTRQFKENTLASYYLKTVMMWFKESVDDSFWQNSRSYIFMMGLKYFNKMLKRGEIPYYWNKNYNLLMAVNPLTISNWTNRIDRIIKTLENNVSDEIVHLRKNMYDFLGIENTKVDEAGKKNAVSSIDVQQNPGRCIIS